MQDNLKNKATKVLQESGVLTSEEAIVLLRFLAGETVTSKMLNNLPTAIAKIVPLVISKLVNEYQELERKLQDISKKLSIYKQEQELEKDLYLQLISGGELEPEKVAKLPTETRNIVRAFNETRTLLNTAREKYDKLLADIEKITKYIRSVRADEHTLDRYEVADELLPLANAVANVVESANERIKQTLLSTIEEGLKTGTYKDVSKEVIDAINRLVIRRVEEIVKPYEDLSRQYVAGEISHDEFTEALKKNALLQHMREQVISDLINALEEGRIDAPEIPPKLRMVIQNLIKRTTQSQRTPSFKEPVI